MTMDVASARDWGVRQICGGEGFQHPRAHARGYTELAKIQ